MKRSRMIKLMAEEFLREGASMNTTPRSIADVMLRAAEKAGMLPPLNEPNYRHNGCKRDINSAKFFFQWEKEN